MKSRKKPKRSAARVAQYSLIELSRGGFRWKLTASNGAPVCVSADKFAKRSNAYRAIRQARIVAKIAMLTIGA